MRFRFPSGLSLSALSLLAAASLALAGGGQQPQPAPLKLGQQSYLYTCQGGERVTVTYLTTAPEREASPVFAVLRFQGRSYGLAPAVSGSGSRYVGHAGLNTASGLEWWEHHDEATLSSFRGDDARQTRPLLKCRIRL